MDPTLRPKIDYTRAVVTGGGTQGTCTIVQEKAIALSVEFAMIAGGLGEFRCNCAMPAWRR